MKRSCRPEPLTQPTPGGRVRVASGTESVRNTIFRRTQLSGRAAVRARRHASPEVDLGDTDE